METVAWVRMLNYWAMMRKIGVKGAEIIIFLFSHSDGGVATFTRFMLHLFFLQVFSYLASIVVVP